MGCCPCMATTWCASQRRSLSSSSLAKNAIKVPPAPLGVTCSRHTWPALVFSVTGVSCSIPVISIQKLIAAKGITQWPSIIGAEQRRAQLPGAIHVLPHCGPPDVVITVAPDVVITVLAHELVCGVMRQREGVQRGGGGGGAVGHGGITQPSECVVEQLVEGRVDGAVREGHGPGRRVGRGVVVDHMSRN